MLKKFVCLLELTILRKIRRVDFLRKHQKLDFDLKYEHCVHVLVLNKLQCVVNLYLVLPDVWRGSTLGMVENRFILFRKVLKSLLFFSFACTVILAFVSHKHNLLHTREQKKKGENPENFNKVKHFVLGQYNTYAIAGIS